MIKECYNFVGGARVETTLQDIDSGTFSLPTGHPMIEHTPTADVKWKEFWQEQDEAGEFDTGKTAQYEAIKENLYT